MIIKNSIHYTIGLIALLFTYVAIAAPAATESNPEKITTKTADQIHAVDVAKFNRIAVFAGEKRAELEKRKLAVDNAYKKWAELQSSTETSNNPNKLKAIEAATQSYLQANLALVNLQKEILVKSGIVSDGVVLSDVVNALNAVTPSAAGSQSAKHNTRSGEPVGRPLP